MKTANKKQKTQTSFTFLIKKCRVYLYLPWLETSLAGLENKIKASVEKSFFAVEQRVIFTSRLLLPVIKKDVLPALLLNNTVNKFSCYCDSRYVSRTIQQLQDRIRQHVPNFIRATKFQTLATPPLVLANLQPHSCLVSQTKLQE